MRPTVRLDGFTVGIPFSDEVDPGIACYWLPIAVLSGTVFAVLLTTGAVIIPLGPKCNRFCLNRSGDVSSFSRSSMCTRSGAVKVVPPRNAAKCLGLACKLCRRNAALLNGRSSLSISDDPVLHRSSQTRFFGKSTHRDGAHCARGNACINPVLVRENISPTGPLRLPALF